MKFVLSFFVMWFVINSLLCQELMKSIQRIPDTGQNKSYTSTLGEDSDYNILVPYYIKNTNSTITDTITGLMWQQTDGGEMTFENALTFVENLTLGGHDDWRLPTALEAYTIQNLQNNNPALDINFFTKNTAEYWWTSDKQKNDPNKIWVTNAGGGIGNHPKTETLSAGGTKRYHARAVRNVKPSILIPARFENIRQDAIFDKLTGLIWEKKPSQNPLTWENALTYAESLTLAGFSDWRLPNIKELQSLQDVNLIQPCINTGYFSSIGIKKYWSSTTLANQEARAWYFDTNFGITTYDVKTNSNYIICTRGPVENNVSGLSQTSISKLRIKIYPNPASDYVKVYLNEATNAPCKISLNDFNGKMLLMHVLDSGISEFIINLDKIQNGQYFLKIASGSVEFIEPISIMKP